MLKCFISHTIQFYWCFKKATEILLCYLTYPSIYISRPEFQTPVLYRTLSLGYFIASETYQGHSRIISFPHTVSQICSCTICCLPVTIAQFQTFRVSSISCLSLPPKFSFHRGSVLQLSLLLCCHHTSNQLSLRAVKEIPSWIPFSF